MRGDENICRETRSNHSFACGRNLLFRSGGRKQMRATGPGSYVVRPHRWSGPDWFEQFVAFTCKMMATLWGRLGGNLFVFWSLMLWCQWLRFLHPKKNLKTDDKTPTFVKTYQIRQKHFDALMRYFLRCIHVEVYSLSVMETFFGTPADVTYWVTWPI